MIIFIFFLSIVQGKRHENDTQFGVLFHWYTKQRRKKNGENRPKKGLKPKVFMLIYPETMTHIFTKKKPHFKIPFNLTPSQPQGWKLLEVIFEHLYNLSHFLNIFKWKCQLQGYFCWTMYSKLTPLPFPHQPYAVLIQSIYPLKLSFTFLNIMAFWNLKLCILKFYLRLNFY